MTHSTSTLASVVPSSLLVKGAATQEPSRFPSSSHYIAGQAAYLLNGACPPGCSRGYGQELSDTGDVVWAARRGRSITR